MTSKVTLLRIAVEEESALKEFLCTHVEKEAVCRFQEPLEVRLCQLPKKNHPGQCAMEWSGASKLVEAVGIEPTSEERVGEASTCVAFVQEISPTVLRTKTTGTVSQPRFESGPGARHLGPFDPLLRRPRQTR